MFRYLQISIETKEAAVSAIKTYYELLNLKQSDFKFWMEKKFPANDIFLIAFDMDE